MGLIDNGQIPIRLAQPRKDVATLGQVKRGDDLFLLHPLVHAKLVADVTTLDDEELFVELFVQFALPLKGEIGRTDNKNPLGKPAEVAIVRDGESKTVEVIIEEQPQNLGGTRVPAPRPPRDDGAGAMRLDKLGVVLGDLTDVMADDLGYRAGTRGPVITEVEGASAAALAGLKRGMLVTKVENQTVAAAADAAALLQKANLARGVLLQVQSPRGGTTFVLVRNQPAGD